MSAPKAGEPSTRAVPLDEAGLAELDERVRVPTYDRAALVPAVVHIGVGGFHRAHQGVLFDELAERGISTDWGVIGVGLHSGRMQEVLGPQGWLYTLVERSADGDTARVVASMVDYISGGSDPDRVFEVLTAETTRLVTLTITGTGYHIDPHTGELEKDEEEIAEDLERPQEPQSAVGYIVEALARRRDADIAPFTVLSCDNMQDNGEAARTAIVSFAHEHDPQLAAWIAENVTFPSSMVDRITPETTDEDREWVAETFGVDDRWPVVTEKFTQWIIEDNFCNGRPPLDEVGVQFVPHVKPYEVMKTRLLNGSHCAIGYLGTLCGYSTTAETMADPLFREFIGQMMDADVVPLLPEVPGIDLGEYTGTLLERFSNPSISDDLGRLCRRGSTKVPNYLLPSVSEAIAQGRPHLLLTLAVAGWLRYLRGHDYAGEPIELQDAKAHILQPKAAEAGSDPRPLLQERSVFGDLGKDETFIASVEAALEALEEGPREAMEAYLRMDNEEVAA